MTEHFLKVSRTARYLVLGNTEAAVHRIWFVLHGYGMNAETFLSGFESLVKPGVLVVAPEGLNRFYQKGFYGNTGANWMTKTMREHEIADHLHYLDLLKSNFLEQYPTHQAVVLGFSQGTAMASRWVYHSPFQNQALILWAGELAQELISETPKLCAKVQYASMWFGREDPFIPNQAIEELPTLVKAHWEINRYHGAHEVYPEVLEQLSKRIDQMLTS